MSEQKIVSFEVAKAIKEAGYPQELPPTPVWYYYRDGSLHYGELNNDDKYEAPYVMDIWLWLWREKKIAIGCPYENTYNYWFTNINAENDESLILWKYSSGESNDPEEAIEQAIEYLVKNNLIK